MCQLKCGCDGYTITGKLPTDVLPLATMHGITWALTVTQRVKWQSMPNHPEAVQCWQARQEWKIRYKVLHHLEPGETRAHQHKTNHS